MIMDPIALQALSQRIHHALKSDEPPEDPQQFADWLAAALLDNSDLPQEVYVVYDPTRDSVPVQMFWEEGEALDFIQERSWHELRKLEDILVAYTFREQEYKPDQPFTEYRVVVVHAPDHAQGFHEPTFEVVPVYDTRPGSFGEKADLEYAQSLVKRHEDILERKGWQGLVFLQQRHRSDWRDV